MVGGRRSIVAVVWVLGSEDVGRDVDLVSCLVAWLLYVDGQEVGSAGKCCGAP